MFAFRYLRIFSRGDDGCGFEGGVSGAIRVHIASLKRQLSSCRDFIALPSEQKITFVGQVNRGLFQPTEIGSKSLAQ